MHREEKRDIKVSLQYTESALLDELDEQTHIEKQFHFSAKWCCVEYSKSSGYKSNNGIEKWEAVQGKCLSSSLSAALPH